MKIHEFQAKQILRDAGVAVLPGHRGRGRPRKRPPRFTNLGGAVAVVKAQIHAGGRGKGTVQGDPDQHGVQLVRTCRRSRRGGQPAAGPDSWSRSRPAPPARRCARCWSKKAATSPASCTWASCVDRAAAKPVLMVSSEGGMEIEKVAAETPELIFKEHFRSGTSGLQSYQVRKLCAKLGLTGASVRAADQFMKALCRVFVQYDCSLVEINPLVVTGDGELVALDAKMTFDDNAPVPPPGASPSCATCRKKSRPRSAPPRRG